MAASHTPKGRQKLSPRDVIMSATSAIRRFDYRNVPTYSQSGASDRARRASQARKTQTLKTNGRGHPTTSEMDYSDAETEFFKAVDQWKNQTGRRFPTLAEILRIARSIGYTQGVEPIDLEETQEFDTAALARAVAEADELERQAREKEARCQRLREIVEKVRKERAG
jgi:hypothetical protein